MSLTDLNKPWFHKTADRGSIQAKLSISNAGTFVIRPSSHGNGCYAMSWSNGDGSVNHNLIYNLFPGFSLKDKPSATDKLYQTLTQLVEDSDYLTEALDLSAEEDIERAKISQSPQTSTATVSRLVSKLIENDPLFTTLEWRLDIIENPRNPFQARSTEQRTYICYASEQYTAPALFKLEGSTAAIVFKAMSRNSVLLSLKLCGSSGLMNVNFKPNLQDEEVEILVEALLENNSITCLDLSHNYITDRGAFALASVLAHKKNMKKIYLGYNLIGTKGLTHLARAAKSNPFLEVMQLSNQLVCHLSSVKASRNQLDHHIIQIITHSYSRKRELTSPEIVGFHGFLTPLEAESKLGEKLRQVLSSDPLPQYDGHFLFYLNCFVPNCIYVCYTTLEVNDEGDEPEGQVMVTHKPIYRTPTGYTFNRRLEDDPLIDLEEEYSIALTNHGERVISVPSLSVHCSWLLCSCPQLYSGVEDCMHEDMAQQIQHSRELVDLWQIQHIPTDVPDSISSFPTLAALIQRNKEILKYSTTK